jgi:hypothetical protein
MTLRGFRYINRRLRNTSIRVGRLKLSLPVFVAMPRATG